MTVRDPFGDGQAKTGSTVVSVSRLVFSEEPGEDLVQVLLLDADTVVHDTDDPLIFGRGYGKLYDAFILGVLQGIIHEDDQKLMQILIVSFDDHLFGRWNIAEPFVLNHGELSIDDGDVIAQFSEVKPLHLIKGRSRIGSGENHQIGDHSGDSPAFPKGRFDVLVFVDDLLFRITKQSFQTTLYHRNGRSQFMRRILKKCPLLLDGFFHGPYGGVGQHIADADGCEDDENASVYENFLQAVEHSDIRVNVVEHLHLSQFIFQKQIEADGSVVTAFVGDGSDLLQRNILNLTEPILIEFRKWEFRVQSAILVAYDGDGLGIQRKRHLEFSVIDPLHSGLEEHQVLVHLADLIGGNKHEDTHRKEQNDDEEGGNVPDDDPKLFLLHPILPPQRTYTLIP